jgi:hypothetical protein
MHLKTWLEKLCDEDRTTFYTNLEYMHSMRFGTRPAFDYTLYDKGLIYGVDDSVTPLNFPVEKVLYETYIKESKVEAVSSRKDPSEQGHILQRQSLLMECRGKLSFQTHYASIAKDLKQKPSEFSYLVRDRHLFGESHGVSFKFSDRIKCSETTLFIPNFGSFPHIDYIVYVPECKCIIFKQITMSTVSGHLVKPGSYLLENEYKGYGSVREVMHFLLDKKYVFTESGNFIPVSKHDSTKKLPGYSLCQGLIKYILDEDVEIELVGDDLDKQAEFRVKNRLGNILDVRIIYCTGKFEKDVKNTDLKLQNIEYYGRDEMEKNGIKF